MDSNHGFQRRSEKRIAEKARSAAMRVGRTHPLGDVGHGSTNLGGFLADLASERAFHGGRQLAVRSKRNGRRVRRRSLQLLEATRDSSEGARHRGIDQGLEC